MPNILAAAADPHSWAKLMGLGSETTNVSINTKLTTNKLNIINKLPAYIRQALSSNILQIKFGLQSVLNTNSSSGGAASTGTADWRKLFSVKNSVGNLILSLGYDNSPTANIAGYLAFSSNFKLYVWDGADTPTVVTSFTMWNYRLAVGLTNYESETQLDYECSIAISINTTTPANSFLYLDVNSIVTTVTGASLHGAANMNLGMFTLCETNTVGNSSINVVNYLSYMVISDYIDKTLKAVPFKPSAFGSVNDFTGLISTVTAWVQDKNYLTTSVEVGAATSFLLTKPTLTSNYAINCTKSYNTVKKLDNYFMAHYLQTGGTSISFTIALYLGTTQASDNVTVVIPANESDDNYLVKQVSNVVTNIINSSNFTGPDLLNLRVRITLIGV